MSKITFRADDTLIDRLEARDASKSEVMRAALRTHLDAVEEGREPTSEGTLDDSLERLIADRIDAQLDRAPRSSAGSSDVTISIHLADDRVHEVSMTGDEHRLPAQARDDGSAPTSRERSRPTERIEACAQCGSLVEPDHRHCTNCGSERSNEQLCECGLALQQEWQFCPGCGRRRHTIGIFER